VFPRPEDAVFLLSPTTEDSSKKSRKRGRPSSGVRLDQLLVRHFIRRRNLRINQVAKKLRVSPQNFSAWLHGKARIPTSMVAALAEILGKPPKAILKESPLDSDQASP
jgi:hypothetical protein